MPTRNCREAVLLDRKASHLYCLPRSPFSRQTANRAGPALVANHHFLFGGSTLIVSGSGSGERYVVPEGAHEAICVAVVDLGTQPSPNQQYRDKRQVLIQWCLYTTLHEWEGTAEPAHISRYFTASLSEKAKLREFLEGWRGKSFTADELEGFDLKKLLGIPALLAVKQEQRNGEARAKVLSAMSFNKPSDQQAYDDARANASTYFSFDDPSVAAWQALPEWMQKQIQKSPEYAGWLAEQGADNSSQQSVAVGEGDYDEIPF